MNAEKTRIDWAEVRRRLARSQTAIEGAWAADDQPAVEILRRRAAELSRRRTEASEAAGVPMLVCLLGSERYGLESHSVREVLPFANCTPVPGGPPELLGVINLRGKVRSVISLARVLRLAESDPEQCATRHVAIVQIPRLANTPSPGAPGGWPSPRPSPGVPGEGVIEMALQVDQVERIARVSMDSLQSPGKADQAGSENYVRGVTAEGIIVLDLTGLIADRVLMESNRKLCR